MSSRRIHIVFGWSVVALVAAQVLGGWLRGSKGGPTDPATDGGWTGDHYSMTRRRLLFEYLHKSGGYLAIAVATGSILSGLWHANGPVWMWLCLATWWIMLIGVFIALQKKGRAFDTYQAIWGPDRIHPGNCRQPIGIGIVRPGESAGNR